MRKLEELLAILKERALEDRVTVLKISESESYCVHCLKAGTVTKATLRAKRGYY